MPVTVTVLPVAATRGRNEAMVGAPTAAVTVKEPGLVTSVDPVCTVIDPLVAPVGTVTTSCVAVAEATVAATPLNFTVLDEGVVEKPEP